MAFMRFSVLTMKAAWVHEKHSRFVVLRRCEVLDPR